MAEPSYWKYYADTWLISRVETNGYQMSYEHTHGHHELVFTFTANPLRHTISGTPYEIASSHIIYRSPYTLHSTTALTDDTYIRYKLDFNSCLLVNYENILSLGFLQQANELLIPTTSDQMENLRSLLDMLCEESDKTWNGCLNPVSVGLIAVILSKVNDLAKVISTIHQDTIPYIQDVMYYIIVHISEGLTVESLSRIFFVSPAKLYHDFWIATSLTLHEYITAVRISLARMWLQDDIPVAQIAERCGFSQASAFIVMFKRITGITPGAFRKQFGLTYHRTWR